MGKPRDNLPHDHRAHPASDLLETHSFRPLAVALTERTGRIIGRWETLVREVLPAADALTLAQVRDELPATLARVARALGSATAEPARALLEHAHGHGEERFHQGYDVDELLIEYRLLRRVVVEEVEGAMSRRTTTAEDLALGMAVDAVLHQGVAAYVRRQRQELRAAAEAESKFLSYLSHDLRNQLNHVGAVLQLLTVKLADAPEFSDDVAEVHAVRRAIFETVEGMERLLQAERLRKGNVELRRGPVALAGFVNDVAAPFFRLAEEKGLKLVTDVPPDATCDTDRRLLGLILQNLLGNAIKYSARGAVGVTVTRCEGDAWCLSVSDEGPGIAPEDQHRLFEEFVRGDTHGQAGIGLGLAIAARAAKMLGAKLTVESAVGTGSTFRLTCPATD